MSTSFFHRTASVAALLLAAVGMQVPLLAAVTTHPAHPSKAVIDSDGRVLHGNAAHRFLSGQQKKKVTPTLQTPFTRIMAPKIKAQQAKMLAEKKAGTFPSASKAARPRANSTGLVGPNGLAVTFPGFFHPSLITTVPDTDDADVSQAVTADVNKDGKPDLITIQDNGRINVLLNTGSGLPANISSTNNSVVNENIDFVTAVDLNGDGYPDLELVDGDDGYVYILMNNGASGSGTFGTATQITLPLPSGNYVDFGNEGYGGDVIFADITGDGKPDMVVLSGQYPNATDTSLTVQLFAGVGDGTFPVVTQTETSTVHNYYVSGSFHSLQAADVNNDGQLDLVFPSDNQPENGSVVPPVHPAASVHSNDDTADDFAYTYVLTGNNLGIFSPFPDDVTSASPGAYAVNTGESIYSSYVGNIGNNTYPGVVIVGNQAIYTQESNNDATLQPAVSSAIYTDDTEDAKVADVNGDGKVDIISYGDGYLSMFAGGGDGTFNVNAVTQMIMGYSSYQAAQPADFDGDGIVDIIGVNDYASAGLYLGLGSGAFKGAPVIAPPGEDPYDVSAVVAGNFSGKGFADVVAYDFNTGPYSLVTAVNDGKGNFTYKTAIDGTTLSSIGSPYVEPVTLDIDNNGTQDLLLSSGSGLYAALSNGDGTFATPVLVPLGGTLACGLNYAGVTDLNGDGKQDVILPYGGCGSGDFADAGFFTLINNGDGTFTPSFTAGGGDPYTVSFADFNGDGNADLLLLDNGGIGLFPGNGDGTFNTGAFELVFGGEGVLGMLTGDFNNDGKQDVVALGDGDGGFGAALLLGKGDYTFPEASFTPLSFLFFPYGGVAADFNGDGKLDIALEGYTDDTYEYNAGIGVLVNLGAGNFSAPILLPTIYSNEELSQGYATPIVLGDFNSDGAPDFMAVSYYTSGIFYNAGAVSLALTTSSATATQDSSVTLTATLTPSLPGAQATGTVTFYDNGVAIGTVPVSGNGATLTLSTLPVGANAITAVYSGDTNYNSATSSTNVNMTAVTVTALPAAFTMTTVSGGTLDLTVGQTGVATFSVTGNATFSGPIALACTGAPAGTSCTISPSTITLTGAQTATFTAVLDTTAPNNHFNATNSFPTWLKTTGGITLAGGLLLLWPSRRRRNLWTLVLVSTLGLGAMATITGCSHKYSGTPAGTYTINVTATAGSVTQTGTIALTIHQ